MDGEGSFYLDGGAWQEGRVDLRREIKRSGLNMLRMGCLLDTKIETLNRQLNIDVWGPGGRYGWKHTSEKPECVRRYSDPLI